MNGLLGRAGRMRRVRSLEGLEVQSAGPVWWLVCARRPSGQCPAVLYVVVRYYDLGCPGFCSASIAIASHRIARGGPSSGR